MTRLAALSFVLLALAGCGGTEPPPVADKAAGQVRYDQGGDGVNPFTLTPVHVVVDGRSVPCIVLDDTTLSCDWSPR